MPSSPTFTDYNRQPERFFYRGISLLPQDALPEGKSAFALNIRSYQEGTITVRQGWSAISSSDLGDPVHSLFRLNDTTPYVTPGDEGRRIAGAGNDLYGASVGSGTFNSIASGQYSGNPLTGVVATPWASPRPYLYVGDSSATAKYNADFTEYAVGIASPAIEPDAVYAPVLLTFANTIGVAAWSQYGVATAVTGPTFRINTVVTQILYDEGSAPGMASIALLDMTGVTPGISLEIGPSVETVIVEEVHPPLSPTTIASIIYDSGSTGMATIQPTGSFSMGQIEAAVPADVQQRYTAQGQVPPRVTVSRTVDYPVDSLVLIGGVETVKIQSVAIGPDGTQSFRCFLNGTFAAGAAVDGLASFRAYCNTAVAVADIANAVYITDTITPPSIDAVVGGIQSPAGGGLRDWGLVGNRASQPSDYIRFGIRLSSYANIDSVRLLMNLSDDDGFGGADFLHNYYFYEWRKNDLLAAVQSAVGVATGLMSTSQAGAVQQGQIAGYYQDQYGYNNILIDTSGTPIIGTAESKVTGWTGSHHNSELVTRARTQQADANVSVGGGISRQLAVGNEQWVVLQCRISDLTRIGTDFTKSLSTINAFAISVQVSGTTDLITIDYADAYLLGGYGPDVSQTWNPYVYRYRYRSTITGARSNFSPPMRAGVKPHRGRIALSGTASSDAQVDMMDWFRLGGGLARWSYVGSESNGSSFNDDYSDIQIESGETLSFNFYQPWPVQDLPRSGTCNVAGTAIQRVGGDSFDTRWAEGSAIIIDGRATALYRQPDSSSLLHVKDNCGSGSAVTFSLPSPTILSQPLPYIWGGALDGVVFIFACGDPSDPGVLHWTQGNDPDSTSDINTLYITTASDPLINGCFYDGVPYVFSSTKLYRIVPTFGGLSTFRAEETSCTKGLWSPWAFCSTPFGIAFLSSDGVYVTAGGAEPKPLTDPDLRPLFPQDGSTPQTIRNLVPVDFTATANLKLTYIDDYLYFDYADTDGNLRTLVFDPRVQGWTPDLYALSGVTARLLEDGENTHTAIVGANDGNIYLMDATKTTDILTDIDWAVWTMWQHGGDPRAWKQWGDAILDMNPGGSVNGIQVTPVITNGNTALDPQLIGAGANVRDTFLVEVGATSGELGDGPWSRNFGLWIEGAVQACDVQRPLLYLWEPSFAAKQVSAARRATDWQDLGYNGAKFIQGVVLRCNTFDQGKIISVQYDGPNDAPQTALTFTATHNGEQTIAYPRSSAGWTPFVAELVRLQGGDDVEWALLDWRFVWEPAPELATQWETQFTTHDFPGFLAVYDGVIAYEAPSTVTWTVEYVDGMSGSYILPATSGYLRTRVITQAQKGKAVRYRWTSDEPFRLYKNDCSVRVQPWGAPVAHQIMSPFGGPSRVDGAGI